MSELSTEKSQELADSILSIKMALYGIDLDYAKKAVEKMQETLSFQESAMVLNPNPFTAIEQAEHKNTQLRFFEKIVELVELEKDIHASKEKLLDAEKSQSELKSMFGL